MTYSFYLIRGMKNLKRKRKKGVKYLGEGYAKEGLRFSFTLVDRREIKYQIYTF